MIETSFVEINLNTLEKNMKAISNRLGNDKRIIGVVKADAYGHGVAPITRKMKQIGIKDFAVATLLEGLEIREFDKESSVLILGFVNPEDARAVINNDLTFNIISYEEAKIFSEVARKLGKKAKVSISIDTGMNRLGFFPTEKSMKEIIKISKLENLSFEELFTHFTMSENVDKSFSEKQLKYFRFSIEYLKKNGVVFSHYHASNSGAITDFPEMSFDTVRPGIIQYGYYPGEGVKKTELEVKPILTWKSRISQIRAVPKGTSISYSNTYIALRDMRVATMSVGYADGYNRLLSNRGFVFINGRKCPVVGKVCMDLTMIDVTDVPDAKIGDEIILLGRCDEGSMDAEDMAKLCNTISYEILCNISKRVIRKYVDRED